jgi:hypothetical protein
MALSNFVADKIFLWDEITRAEFIKIGVDPSRIEITGAYGFGSLKLKNNTIVDQYLIYLCPSYHVSNVDHFIKLGKGIPSSFKIKYSLHPLTQSKYKNLKPQALVRSESRPIIAICGDGGVIMDSLASGIPVITVGTRPLASVHLQHDESISGKNDWFELISKAIFNYHEDRKRFGFIS